MAAGRKTGGRQAGTPNAATLTLREQVEAAAGGPLPVLLATLGRQAMDKGEHQLAVAAFAKAAAYVYARMQAVHLGEDGPPMSISFTDPSPCSSCGHDPAAAPRIHITREIIHGPIPSARQARITGNAEERPGT